MKTKEEIADTMNEALRDLGTSYPNEEAYKVSIMFLSTIAPVLVLTLVDIRDQLVEHNRLLNLFETSLRGGDYSLRRL